ncbi:MAG: FUSC family protein [Neisseria sp.]|uniref:FUSC family protein n=1 Tax=Neisseria sp. TaxID=192066 RepID=UPI0026DC3D70|nr:FUSC family protein [Neisseria sp.]MDO4640686.1 FUSC family protein [Neisseria sp.]
MLNRYLALAINEFRSLFTISPNRRPVGLAISSALSLGLPLFIGQYFGHPNYGLVSSLGGLIFLYLPGTHLIHRMISMLCITSLISGCFFFGLIAYHFPLLHIPVAFSMTMLVGILCRFFNVPPPRIMFFLMAAMIGMYLPHPVEAIPLLTGLLFLGALNACLIAFVYSLFRLWKGDTVQPPPEMDKDIHGVVVSALIIAAFTAGALTLAEILQLDRPYWVPISCIAIIQGLDFRTAWTRQLHRIIGTTLGLGLTWLLLLLPINGWWVCLLLTCLSFITELLVVRHYAAAVIFITPLTIFLAEVGARTHLDPSALMASRFIDTVYGCLFGLAGAWFLYQSGKQEKWTQWLKKRF